MAAALKRLVPLGFNSAKSLGFNSSNVPQSLGISMMKNPGVINRFECRKISQYSNKPDKAEMARLLESEGMASKDAAAVANLIVDGFFEHVASTYVTKEEMEKLQHQFSVEHETLGREAENLRSSMKKMRCGIMCEIDEFEAARAELEKVKKRVQRISKYAKIAAVCLVLYWIFW